MVYTSAAAVIIIRYISAFAGLTLLRGEGWMLEDSKRFGWNYTDKEGCSDCPTAYGRSTITMPTQIMIIQRAILSSDLTTTT